MAVVTAPTAVTVRELHKSFENHRVLAGVDVSINPGEFVALLGASGSGKSTLLRILAGLDTDYSGHLSLPERRAVVFQEHRLMPWKRVTANVALGLEGEDTQARSKAMLEEVGLREHGRAWPRTLSGGESQRVALARALVRSPELLLLDEPFGALDALTRMRVHSLVLSLWERHRPSVLLVTHDVDEALLLADRALVLRDGRVDVDLHIASSRPRRRADPAVEGLRTRILQTLGVAEAP